MNYKQYLNKYPTHAGLFILIVTTFFVYYSSLFYPFYPNLDDGKLILQNPSVKGFPSGFWSIFTEFVYGLYHPFTTLSLAFDGLIWGFHPFGFRLHNLLLHITNVLLVYIFVEKLSKNRKLSFFAATVFALHPMHVESVIWVSERKDVLFTFYFLLALITYIQWNNSKKRIWMAATGLFFISSLFSKATAVVLPLFLLVIDYLNGALTLKNGIKKIPLFLISVLFGILNIKAQQTIDFIQPISDTYSLGQLITLPVYSFSWYITQLFIPLQLNIKHLYPRVIHGEIGMEYYFGWLWFALLLIVALKFRKNRLFVAGLFIYFFSIILLVKIIPTGNDIVSERYSYLPYIGLTLALGALLPSVFNNGKKGIFYGFLIIIMVLMSFGTIKQQSYWSDEKQIWTRVSQIEPDLPLAYFERGKVFQDEKNFQGAISDYQRAIRVEPRFYQGYLQSGICYYLLNNNDSANVNFNKAVAAAPNEAITYFQRGFYYYKTAKYSGAITDFQKCESMGFTNNDVYFYMALSLKGLNEFEKSIDVFTHLLQKDPEHSSARFEMAQVYVQMQQYNEAISLFEQIVQKEPNNLQASYLLANTMIKVQKYEDAIRYYTLVIEKKPDFGAAWLNLGNAYWLAGNTRNAQQSWEQAKKLGIENAQRMLELYGNP